MGIDLLLALLLKTTLASSAAIVVVLALRKPLRARFGAGVAYASWSLIPVAWLAMLLPAPVGPMVHMLPGARVGVAQVATSMHVAVPLPLHAWLLCAWAIGVVATLAVFVVQQRCFHRGLRAGETRGGVQFANAMAGLPAAVGVLRPRIVLPADFKTRYDAVERELILCHERVHVHRLDLQVNALAAAIRCIQWFNPLMHFAAARFRQDQELACDARVITLHPQRRRIYAAAMLKTQLAVSSPPLGCHWQDFHPLKERIEMLKLHAKSPHRARAGALIVSLLTLSFGCVAWAAQPAKSAHADASVDIQSKGTHPPAYPKDAIKKGISGKVVLLVDVAADGNVVKVTVDKSEPQGVFDEVSLEAAKKWKFTPAYEHGQPVAGRVRVPVYFEVNGNSSEKTEAKG